MSRQTILFTTVRSEGALLPPDLLARVANRGKDLAMLQPVDFGLAAGDRLNEAAARASNGHPDLNGIWQAVNTANYDLEPHSARHAMALRPGPHGPVPAKEVLYLGAVGALLSDLFPVTTRTTGISLGYNLGVMLFGGFAPFIMTWLAVKIASAAVPGY